jgi:DeoR/GlpR family transcriptional regulator of sugar metabolism
MKHFTILNRQGLLTRSYGKAVPISSKRAAALDGRQREAESYQKIAAR